jgi:23S rRNA-/tRNA-specific pseudouridylate synthase
MIPLSDSVEALTLLVPGAPPPPRVLHEERDWLAVDKPAFLPTTPQGEYDDSLLARVRRLPGMADAVPAHRLDVGTSGICCFAKRPNAAAALARALAAGEKQYLVLARGIVRKKGRIERVLLEGGARRAAATSYRREAVVGTHSLVRASLESGRKHQIRRHFASIGHPVLGDERHGDPATNRHFIERHGLDRPFLHCLRLAVHLEGRELTVESELAFDLRAVLASLEATRAKPAEPGPNPSGAGQEPAPSRE